MDKQQRTVNEVLANEAVAEEFFAQETPEAAQAFLKGKGVEISLEEINEIAAEIKKMKDGELSENDLENVAGGRKIKVYKILPLKLFGKRY